MKDVIEIIKTRRSVRNYKKDTIPDYDIEFLIDCARYAPSGFNFQPWAFLVIKNKEILQKISEKSRKSLTALSETVNNYKNAGQTHLRISKEGEDILHNAPVLVIILGKENWLTVEHDCALAAQNMMLAAHSMGIGSCWIGRAKLSLMEKEFLKALRVPEGYKAVAPIILGYPERETKPPEKLEPQVIWLK